MVPRVFISTKGLETEGRGEGAGKWGMGGGERMFLSKTGFELTTCPSAV